MTFPRGRVILLYPKIVKSTDRSVGKNSTRGKELFAADFPRFFPRKSAAKESIVRIHIPTSGFRLTKSPFRIKYTPHAEVAELADALGSGLSGRKVVRVQVPPSAPTDSQKCGSFFIHHREHRAHGKKYFLSQKNLCALRILIIPAGLW
jgi:hypothetical protein